MKFKNLFKKKEVPKQKQPLTICMTDGRSHLIAGYESLEELAASIKQSKENSTWFALESENSSRLLDPNQIIEIIEWKE